MKTEQLLVVQTGPLPALIFMLGQLRSRFPACQFTVFCRGESPTLVAVEKSGLADRIVTRELGESLAASRRKLSQFRFDGCVVSEIDSRSYWRAKWMSLLLGVRPLLVLDSRLQLRTLSWPRFIAFVHWPGRDAPAEYVAFRDSFEEDTSSLRVLVVETMDRPEWRVRHRVVSELFGRGQLVLATSDPSEAPPHFARVLLLQPGAPLPATDRSGPWDGVVVFDTGRAGYGRWKRDALLIPAWRKVVVNENNDFFYATAKSLAVFALGRLLHGWPAPFFSRVLIPQTDSWANMKAAWERVASNLPEDARFDWLSTDSALPSDLPAEHRLIRYSHDRNDARSLRRMFFELRRQRYPLVVLHLSGKPGYAKVKWLALLLRTKALWIVNEYLNYSHGSSAPFLARFALRRLRYGIDKQVDPRRLGRQKVLMIQSDEEAATLEAIRRLKRGTAAGPNPLVDVLCRADKRASFSESPDVDGVLTYPVERTRTTLTRLLKHLRQQRYDVAAALFTGKPTFRKLKILTWAVGAPQHLLFNEHLDCFYSSPSRLLRLALRRLLRGVDIVGASMPAHQKVLVVQTAEEGFTRQVIGRVLDGSLFYKPTVHLFCREDKRLYFREILPADQIQTYPVRHNIAVLTKSLRRLHKYRYDVVVASLTGRPTYTGFKLLTFAAGARKVLLFNDHLDCFYFSATRLLRFLAERQTAGTHYSPRQAFVLYPLSQLSKLLLFPFRFLYLVIQITALSQLRAYSRNRWREK